MPSVRKVTVSKPAGRAGKLAARVPSPRLGREQRIDEILVAARDVFCRKGYEQTAVSEIAASIGVVEGTVFKYFATKRDLLLAVLERWYDAISDDRARELAGITTHRERLRIVIHGHLRTIRDQPLLCRLMFREVRAEQDYRGSGLHDKNRLYTRFLMDVINDGIAAGEFRRDVSPSLMRDLVYGAVEHLTWNYVCGRGELDVDAIAAELTAMVCDGIETTARVAAANKTPRLANRR
ncbi:TetR/AcrR family transcriptional regulator [Nevskia ramosa]|uniref:TetR/AcrR family transcriptional regulator n=1 Tax=Nevskia ramosa TaxID=64002 RepID=UPI0003B4931B|nr:TetR/AcrR family transcriptional regulator [Nevskia ramosa]